MNEQHRFKVAAVQASPVYLDKEATTQKAVHLIARAAGKGAKLVVFPEVFIAGYPDWIWSVPNNKRALLDELYGQLLRNAVTIPDSTTKALCKAAKDNGVHVIMGMNERNSEASNGSLFNTILYINDQGQILGKHRKLIPTSGERLIWTGGDGTTMQAFDTSMAKIGGLICWENFMPLARFAMYQQGVQIHAAPTWDSSANWQQSMQYIAREGGMFVISCCAAIPMEAIPDSMAFKELYPAGRSWVNVGNSCIIDPRGKFLVEPLAEKEEILLAEINLDEIYQSKRLFDVAGHYNRPDVFRFNLNDRH